MCSQRRQGSAVGILAGLDQDLNAFFALYKSISYQSLLLREKTENIRRGVEELEIERAMLRYEQGL